MKDHYRSLIYMWDNTENNFLGANKSNLNETLKFLKNTSLFKTDSKRNRVTEVTVIVILLTKNNSELKTFI